MAIDPGTNTLGVSILSLDLEYGVITVEFVTTLVAENMVRPYESIVTYHSERFTKLYALQNSLTYLMSQFQVHAVVSESPYLGRFPQAFAALTECMSMLRNAMLNFDPYMYLFTIDPATIKTNVGVSGKSGDKLLMRKAVMDLWNRQEIQISNGIILSELDEHSIDSIAAGYSRLRQML
jgi:Holliday junction resolvasome RuvABC endonuclease subunit